MRGGGDQTFYPRVNSGGDAGVSNTDASGHYISNRSASNAVQGYRNGSNVLSLTTASAALVTRPVAVGGNNSSGTIDSSNHIISAATIGASLDATKALALYNRLATYRTAVGL